MTYRKPVAVVPQYRNPDSEDNEWVGFIVFCDDGTVWDYTTIGGYWDEREGSAMPGSAQGLPDEDRN